MGCLQEKLIFVFREKVKVQNLRQGLAVTCAFHVPSACEIDAHEIRKCWEFGKFNQELNPSGCNLLAFLAGMLVVL